MANILRSTSDFEVIIGEQVRRLRIAQNLDQSQLASAANISVGAVKNLEGGKGSSLKSLILALRVLKAEQWLSTLSPEITVSPLQMLRDQKLKQPRSRVYRSRNV
jgi:transcriptional regulator with XRE-family HTH domain